MHRLRRHLIATYLSFDPRSLALFRILFGIVLLFDLYLRYNGVDFWYTDDGILGRPNLARKFTLFKLASTHGQAVFGMAACAFAYLAFVLGFRTRAAHLLSLIGYVSLNGRAVMVENSGNYVIALLGLWSLFLPLGRRFSLDAVLRRRRFGETAGGDENRPVVSLAVLALLLQISVLYLFNALHKTGTTWVDGSAVHYTLHQDRIVTAAGVWVRDHLPYPLLQYLTWGTIAIEVAAVALILSPIWTRHLRLAAVLAMPALHVGFALCVDLGAFSWVMISYFALLLAPQHWNWLGTIRRRSARRIASPDREPVAVAQPPSPGRLRATRWASGLREALVVLLAVVSFGEVARANPSMPHWMRYRQPEAFDSFVKYLGLFQHWRMFSPDAPVYDRTLIVEARTADGRLVDPYNEVASRFSDPTFEEIPTRLGQGQFFGNYSLRSPFERFNGYRAAFRRWILTYHRRTGNPGDRIVSFTIYVAKDRTPRPGSQPRPRRVYRRSIMEFP